MRRRSTRLRNIDPPICLVFNAAGQKGKKLLWTETTSSPQTAVRRASSPWRRVVSCIQTMANGWALRARQEVPVRAAFSVESAPSVSTLLRGRLNLKEVSTWNMSHKHLMLKKVKYKSQDIRFTHTHTHINKYLQMQDGGKHFHLSLKVHTSKM